MREVGSRQPRITSVERLKFALLAEGLTITARALHYVNDRNEGRALTPADYASTSGVILELDGRVWVNAPIAEHNPNFVGDTSAVLDFIDDGLVLRAPDVECSAAFWLPPKYHGTMGSDATPHNNYVFTHGDRARVAPVRGCAMTCKFCNVPYEDRYGTKPVGRLLEAARVALDDPLQPAQHILVSGGTPKAVDHDYLGEVYQSMCVAFPAVSIDVMMVPIERVLEPLWLHGLGVDELSVNLELFNDGVGQRLMRHKHAQGLDYYLNYLERAAGVFGPGRTRSMLMVGLESIEDTLRGVEAIARRGCTPVLSPFRPDPATPLASTPPPGAALLEEVFLRATEVATDLGVELGPGCLPCTHNTLSFGPDAGRAVFVHPRPAMI